MTSTMRRDAILEKKANQGPIWHYSALIFIIAFFPTIISIYKLQYYNSLSYDEYSTLKEEVHPQTYESYKADFIYNPIEGDVYEYMIDDTTFSTMKVEKITNEYLSVKLNIKTVPEKTKIYQIDLLKNYPEDGIVYSRSHILSMFISDTIYNIYR